MKGFLDLLKNGHNNICTIFFCNNFVQKEVNYKDFFIRTYLKCHTFLSELNRCGGKLTRVRKGQSINDIKTNTSSYILRRPHKFEEILILFKILWPSFNTRILKETRNVLKY